MIRNGKYIPTDIFGNKLKEGMKIVYILNPHGYCVLSWATINKIEWQDSPNYPRAKAFKIHATKYSQRGSWDDSVDKFPKQVMLRNPTALIVGCGIEDYTP